MSVKFGVAFDGSEQGQRALQRCLMVAKSGEDEIHLIHAIGMIKEHIFASGSPRKFCRGRAQTFFFIFLSRFQNFFGADVALWLLQCTEAARPHMILAFVILFCLDESKRDYFFFVFFFRSPQNGSSIWNVTRGSRKSYRR
jgi:hypothetical protein